jgi:SpoVK/Ycf46/Vps4 family AAA+-type ATPase
MHSDSAKFIQYLDSYKCVSNLTSMDFSLLMSVINQNFLENGYYDERLANLKINNVNNSFIPVRNAFAPEQNYYTNYSTSSWNETNMHDPLTYWNSEYNQWQKNNEAILTLVPSPKSLKINTNVPYLPKLNLKDTIANTITPTHKIFIDVSINSLSDILKIINENEYKPNVEYNIDLESLHKIKTELVQLNNMIGLKQMKTAIIDQLLYFVQGLHKGNSTSDFKHTIISGSPGTGKTDIAKMIGQMYSKLGILKNNIFKKVTRNDLIAGYLGQTAIKTRKVIDSCLGGVLFIDEAYSLANSTDNDSYSKECIDILCEALSDHKDELMVIVAGYETELNETLFRVNQGLKSRFIWRLSMDPYTPAELMNIFKKMITEQEWKYAEDDIKERWFDDKKDSFKNYGRDMELLLTYVKIAHGKRIYGKSAELRKIIVASDLNVGYDTFVKNIKPKKETRDFMNSIYN